MFLALMALCKPGDAVAIESPVYFNFLSALDRLGVTPMEIPSEEGEGINLDILRFVIERNPVRAVLTISNFNNPAGGVLPSEKKRKLVELVRRQGIFLIEDDVYGDLAYGARPDTCKAHDQDGRVILCSSFSKTISPGVRLGWMAPGRLYDEIISLKNIVNIGSPSLNQIAVSLFLARGGYDWHVRRIRQGIQEAVSATRRAILGCFPPRHDSHGSRGRVLPLGDASPRVRRHGRLLRRAGE